MTSPKGNNETVTLEIVVNNSYVDELNCMDAMEQIMEYFDLDNSESDRVSSWFFSKYSS